MAVFEKKADAAFLARLAAGVREGEPDADAAAVDESVRSGIAAARHYGLGREADIQRFVALTWDAFGQLPEFPRAALAILMRHTSDAASKLADYAAWIDGLGFDDEDEDDDEDQEDQTDDV